MRGPAFIFRFSKGDYVFRTPASSEATDGPPVMSVEFIDGGDTRITRLMLDGEILCEEKSAAEDGKVSDAMYQFVEAVASEYREAIKTGRTKT